MTLRNKYLLVTWYRRDNSRQKTVFVNIINYLVYVVVLDLKTVWADSTIRYVSYTLMFIVNFYKMN